jgi:hypothetical protein
MITLDEFKLVIQAIEKQIEKDDKLTDFLMNGYLDGLNPVPTFSHESVDMLIKLLAYQFEGSVVFDKKHDDWIGWFIYENDFGKKKLSCSIDKKEYVIENIESFYGFLIIFVESQLPTD